MVSTMTDRIEIAVCQGFEDPAVCRRKRMVRRHVDVDNLTAFLADHHHLPAVVDEKWGNGDGAMGTGQWGRQANRLYCFGMIPPKMPFRNNG